MSWYLWWEGKGNKKRICCQILLNLCACCRWPSSDTSSVVARDLARCWISLGAVEESVPLNPKRQHGYCFCWSHHRSLPQGFADTWFCFTSQCRHWVSLSVAAAPLCRPDPALVEERGKGNRSRMCLLFSLLFGCCRMGGRRCTCWIHG